MHALIEKLQCKINKIKLILPLRDNYHEYLGALLLRLVFHMHTDHFTQAFPLRNGTVCRQRGNEDPQITPSQVLEAPSQTTGSQDYKLLTEKLQSQQHSKQQEKLSSGSPSKEEKTYPFVLVTQTAGSTATHPETSQTEHWR